MQKKAGSQTSSEVLKKFMDDYQTNPFAVSKAIGVAYQTVTSILKGRGRISSKMALCLSAHFGNTQNYWFDVQAKSEIAKLTANKKFSSAVSKIPKAQKPAGKTKTAKKGTGKPAKQGKKAVKAKSKRKL